jgi:ATP-dependent DNA helicase RecG
MKAIVYVKVNGRITNKEYQQLTGVTDGTVLREFKDLLDKGLFEKVGQTGAELISSKPDKLDTKGQQKADC